MSVFLWKSALVAGGLLISSAILADSTTTTGPARATQSIETEAAQAFDPNSDVSIESIEAVFGSLPDPTSGTDEHAVTTMTDDYGTEYKLTD